MQMTNLLLHSFNNVSNVKLSMPMMALKSMAAKTQHMKGNMILTLRWPMVAFSRAMSDHSVWGDLISLIICLSLSFMRSLIASAKLRIFYYFLS